MGRQTRVGTLVWPPSFSAATRKPLVLSELHFPHLRRGSNGTKWRCWRIEVMGVKPVASCLPHIRLLISYSLEIKITMNK